jgi:ABC-2 type transport system ATP-binding protein
MRFFAALYQVSATIFLEGILAKINLLTYKKILAKNLSGGLKRRLNFAIGLINSPDLIFMEEITVGVDPSSRQCILENITELSDTGMTIIYTSHYLHEIEKICQKIVILDQGKVKHEGNVADILHEQVQPKLFIKTQQPVSEVHLSQLNAHYQGDTNNLVLSDIQQPISNILSFLEKNHYDVTSINYGHGSLEAFYLDLLREQAESAIDTSGDAL